MKRLLLTAIAISVLLISSRANGQQRPAPTYANFPMSFEQNMGQTDSQAQFISRGKGYTLFLSSNQAIFKFQSVTLPTLNKLDKKGWGKRFFVDRATKSIRKTAVIRMKLLGANPGAQLVGENRTSGTANYFIGRDPSKWRAGVPVFAKVRSSGVFPGVDLVYYGTERQLEYDFVLKPGADPGAISLGFDGIQGTSIDSSGNLAITTEIGAVTVNKPVVYQMIGGQRKAIEGKYALRGNAVGFDVAEYDKTQPLIIDPVLTYSTLLGGSGDDGIYNVAVDSSGNAYVAGWTDSSDFPIVGTSLTPAPSGIFVAFVAKFNSTGTDLIYSTYLGGNGGEWGNGIALDANGSAYVVGQTGSSNFPVTSNAYQTSLGSGAAQNAFVSKLSADGQSLLYSTYLGGGGYDMGNGIALDANQNAYVTGYTSSGSPNPFPTTANAFQPTLNSVNGNAFISRIDTTKSGSSSLIYSTFLGGSSLYFDQADGIAVDANQNVYVGGLTTSSNFPLTPTAYQSTVDTYNGTAFLTQIDTTKSGSAGLIYSTVIEGWSWAEGVALDATGKVYTTGGYVAKFDTTKSGSASLLYLTRVGGSSDAFTYSISVDSNDDSYVSGWTSSTNLPVTPDAIQTMLGSGGQNSFITSLSPDGSTVLFCTYFGGNGGADDFASGVTLDPNDDIYVVGATQSSNFQTTSGAFQTALDGTSDAFVAKFSPLNVPIIDSANGATFLTGVGDLFTVTASGSPTPSLTESGTLPSGVTFNAATGALSGTPATGSAGSYSITFTASNGVSLNATQNFTLTVVTPPGISASVSPAPNSSGWNNSNVTITFTCVAGSLPIASCPTSQTVSTEGVGQIVSGTVVDTDGDTATASVTINLDKTNPTLTVTSPADQSTESSTPVTVNGTLTDSLSGVSGVTCDGVAATLSGGSFSCNVSLNVGNNLVVVQGTDVAGNVAGDNFHLTLNGTLPAPNSLQVTPTSVNMVVGGTQQFTAVDDHGRPRSDATWSVSNTTVATIDSNSTPTVTAVSVGTATLTASVGNLTANATVTVLSGSSLAPGTIIWSVPPPSGFTISQTIQAVPSANGPALYSVMHDSSDSNTQVTALTSDGQQLWTSATIPGSTAGGSGNSYGDGNGGVALVLWSFGNPYTLVDLDSQTGAPVWQYTYPITSTNFETPAPSNGLAIGQDGTLYPTDGNLLIAVDPTTGASRTVYTVLPSIDFENTPVSACWPGGPTNDVIEAPASGAAFVYAPSVGPDGTVYAQTFSFNLTNNYSCTGTAPNLHENHLSWSTSQTLSLLAVAPTGSASLTTIKSNSDNGNSDNPPYYQVLNGGVNGGEVIPDGTGGALASWQYYLPGASDYGAHIADVSGGAVNDFFMSSLSSNGVTEMVLGDAGTDTAFANDGDVTISFHPSAGQINWAYGSSSGPTAGIVMATNGDGVDINSHDSNGNPMLVEVDHTGMPTLPGLSAANLAPSSQLQMWLGLGAEIEGPADQIPDSTFPLPQGNLQVQSGPPSCQTPNSTCAVVPIADSYQAGTNPQRSITYGVFTLQSGTLTRSLHHEISLLEELLAGSTINCQAGDPHTACSGTDQITDELAAQFTTGSTVRQKLFVDRTQVKIYWPYPVTLPGGFQQTQWFGAYSQQATTSNSYTSGALINQENLDSTGVLCSSGCSKTETNGVTTLP